ncbi:MAG: hypothetical protein ABR511_15120 [Acidimicrobiales bacterium]
MGRIAAMAAVVACLGAASTACDRDTVRVSFRPPVGARYRYQVKVHSETTTRLAGTAPDVTVDDLVLDAEHTVLSAGAGAGDVRVQVRLRQQGVADRTFVVRLDRAAQLAGVDAVEGLPPSVAGPDALPEVLPGAPGAPPARPLSPGERWTIDAPTGLPGAGDARLMGSGRLVALGLLDGRKVATTRSRTTLPLSSTTGLQGSAVALDGTETTDGTAWRLLADGSVERSTTATVGRFKVTLAPADATQATVVGGTLELDVRSETRRLRP